MSTNFQSQFRRYPTAGNKIVADGAPLSTRVPLDMMLAVNNLEYTCPMVGFVNSSSVGSFAQASRIIVGTLPVASAEFFVGQLPTVLPASGIPRFCWTIGMYLGNTYLGSASTVSDVTVYVSSQPYKTTLGTGAAYPGPYLGLTVTTPFDKTQIATPYGTSAIAPAYVVPASTSPAIYKLFDNSAGTTLNVAPFSSPTHDGSQLTVAHLIVTMNVATNDLSASLDQFNAAVMDFTWWTAPE